MPGRAAGDRPGEEDADAAPVSPGLGSPTSPSPARTRAHTCPTGCPACPAILAW